MANARVHGTTGEVPNVRLQLEREQLPLEGTAREQRTREAMLKLATLPAIKTLESYDFRFASGARASRFRAPRPRFHRTPRERPVARPVRGRQDPYRSALALRAAQLGIKTRFISAADLMLQLSIAKGRGRLTAYLSRAVLGQCLLVIDELGYLPFGREEANLSM